MGGRSVEETKHEVVDLWIVELLLKDVGQEPLKESNFSFLSAELHVKINLLVHQAKFPE